MKELGVNRVLNDPAPALLVQTSPRRSFVFPWRISPRNTVLLSPSVTEANDTVL